MPPWAGPRIPTGGRRGRHRRTARPARRGSRRPARPRTRSSASRDSTQSLAARSSARFFCGPKPGQSGVTRTVAAARGRSRRCRRVLPESTTMISSAKAAESRQAPMWTALVEGNDDDRQRGPGNGREAGSAMAALLGLGVEGQIAAAHFRDVVLGADVVVGAPLASARKSSSSRQRAMRAPKRARRPPGYSTPRPSASFLSPARVGGATGTRCTRRHRARYAQRFRGELMTNAVHQAVGSPPPLCGNPRSGRRPRCPRRGLRRAPARRTRRPRRNRKTKSRRRGPVRPQRAPAWSGILLAVSAADVASTRCGPAPGPPARTPAPVRRPRAASTS